MSAHLNPLTIARHLGGDLGPFARWRLRRHLARCPRCLGELNRIEAERAAFDAHPDRGAEIMALAARLPRGQGHVPHAAPPQPARPHWQWAAIPAAALLALFVAWRLLGVDPTSDPRGASPLDDLSPKGSDLFMIYVEGGDGEAAPLGATCGAGDRLQAKIRSARPWVFVVGIDGGGGVSALHPMGGARSIKASAAEAWLPQSWLLDDRPGVERFAAIFSDAPLDLDDAAALLEREPEARAHSAQREVIIERRCRKQDRR